MVIKPKSFPKLMEIIFTSYNRLQDFDTSIQLIYFHTNCYLFNFTILKFPFMQNFPLFVI